MSWASAAMRRPRSAAVILRQSLPGSKARRAAATARSTSSAPAWLTVASRSPVDGSGVSNVAPSAAAARSPSMSSSCVSAARNSRTGSAISVAAMVSVSLLRSQDDLQGLALVIDRVGLGRVGERHVVGDQRAGVQPAGGEQREHAVEVADDVGLAGLHLERLDPHEPHVDLAALGVDADDGDDAGLRGEPDRRLERARVADGLDGDVDAAPAGERADLVARVLLGEVDRGGTE